MPLMAKTVRAPEIGQPWISSAPLSWRGLRGQVVLIDFWAYPCVNCLRTLPYSPAGTRNTMALASP